LGNKKLDIFPFLKNAVCGQITGMFKRKKLHSFLLLGGEKKY